MPALPAVPNVIRVRFFWHIGEDLAAVCHSFTQYSGTAPTNAELNTYAAAVMTNYDSDMKGFFASDRILEEVTVTDLTSSTAALGAATGSIAGTRSGDTLPASVCAVEQRKIARRFRGGHSRIYWPAMTQTDMQDSQTWKAASASAFETAILAFATANLAAAWSGATLIGPVAVSYYSGFTVHTGTTGRARNISTPRTTPIVDSVVDSAVAIGIGSQRKRLLKLA
jgi:hypothetical protein